MYLLDTTVISELRHGKNNPSPQLQSWAAAYAEQDFFISTVTILELEKAVQALEYRTPVQGNALRRWLTGVKILFAGRILPFTEQTARICAALHYPNPKPERNAMLAATAIEHQLTFVTRDGADFSAMGITLINPWNPL